MCAKRSPRTSRTLVKHTLVISTKHTMTGYLAVLHHSLADANVMSGLCWVLRCNSNTATSLPNALSVCRDNRYTVHIYARSLHIHVSPTRDCLTSIWYCFGLTTTLLFPHISILIFPLFPLCVGQRLEFVAAERIAQ